MAATNLGSKIAEWVCALDEAALTDDVIAKLRLAVLDTLAAILAGVPEAVSRHVVERLAGAPANGEATIIGYRARATMPGAALANGTMGHACEYDDCSWTMWGHPTAPALPAVLAAAETRDLSGRAVLAALAVALEVEKTLGLGSQPGHYTLGWHPTATLGVFGAAAGAAKALGLDREQVQMALGIAVSRAAALRLNKGTMTKPLHVGFAARDGIEAAILAGAGATSNPRALDAEAGFFDVYAPGHGAVDGIAEKLGNPFEVIDPGLSPKLYPSCMESHAAVDAILELREEHGLKPDSVRRIRCGITTGARGNLVFSNPGTPLECKFSGEYCIAAALVKGRLGMAEFDDGSVNDADVREVMARIEVFIHPELAGEDAITYNSPAFLEVETADGRTLERRIRQFRGHPDNPLSPSDLEAKFVECGDRVLDPDRVRRARDMVNDLENLTSVRELLRELTP